MYPRHPHYRTKEQRLQTFANFPSLFRATHEEFADAGLFFRGKRDLLRCFFCNGGLKDWFPHDDPYVEHAKWYPSCEFIVNLKGQEFVDDIVAQFPDLRRPKMRFKLTNPSVIPIEESHTKIECKVCFQNEANMVIIPCGHVVTCGICAVQLEKCPICRQNISDRIRSFFA